MNHSPQQLNFIPGLLPQGLIIYCAPHQTDTAYSLLNLALAAATKGMAWSKFQFQQPFNTLLVTPTETRDDVKERFNRICRQLPENLHFSFSESYIFSEDYEWSHISESIQENRIQLMVVDHITFKNFFDDGFRNKNSQFLTRIHRFAKQHRVTIILTHHDEIEPKPSTFQYQFDGLILYNLYIAKANAPSLWFYTGREPTPENFNFPYKRTGVFGFRFDINRPGVVSLYDLE